MKNNNFKLVLFDIGGVLIEYEKVFTTVGQEQHFSNNLIGDTFDKYHREISIGEITPRELYLKCIRENNLKADKDYDFIQSWINDYLTIKPTYDFLIEISAKYNIGLLSNIYKGMVELMIEQEIIPNIDYKYKFLSCDLGMQKPDEVIYQYILDFTQLKPNQILFIDDKNKFIKPAKKKGWEYIFIS